MLDDLDVGPNEDTNLILKGNSFFGMREFCAVLTKVSSVLLVSTKRSKIAVKKGETYDRLYLSLGRGLVQAWSGLVDVVAPFLLLVWSCNW